MARAFRALRAIPHIPYMVRSFSALAEATRAQDWATVVKILEGMHSRGLDSDDTHFRLGCAYAMQERWTEAVGEFEALRTDPRDARERARKYFNHCFALTMIGRREESLGILQSATISEWPPHLRSKGKDLLKHLQDGSAPLPRIH